MRIGVDMDGVLLDIEKYLFEEGSKYFWETKKHTVVDASKYAIYEMFGVSKEEERGFWNKHYCKYIMSEPRKCASEVLNMLSSKGHKIYIITARSLRDLGVGLSKEDMQKMVYMWLDKFNIPYDKICFVEGDKLDACIANKVDVMIEDCPTQIESISKKLKVLCFDAKYNEDVSGDNVIRVYGWYDVLKEINNIKKSK